MVGTVYNDMQKPMISVLCILNTLTTINYQYFCKTLQYVEFIWKTAGASSCQLQQVPCTGSGPG